MNTYGERYGEDARSCVYEQGDGLQSLGRRFNALMMLVTPRSSGRTIRPATTVANHMKLTWRENAGRNDWIALQQDSQSDSGRPFAGFSMVPSMGDSRVGHLRTNQGFTIR